MSSGVTPAGVSSADEIEACAKSAFGFEQLRPGQLEVVLDVLAGRPVVTVMPTGAGKSLCYQLPAVMLGASGGVTLVVSPLIALIKDQVDSLRSRGIDAAALTSAASPSEQDDVLAGIRAGVFTLVYVAPERFRSGRFVGALHQAADRLALIAIDEAHCISEWGHDFRPDYRRLGAAVETLRPPRLIALTATATPEVRDDVARELRMSEPRFHIRGFDRPNLYLAVERAGGTSDKSQKLVNKVKARPSGLALIYAATRKNAERYAEALGQGGLRTRVYHAGLGDEERARAQDAFMADKLDAIVATNAFGMGVDKSDIRLVIHADLPRSPEAYYQEAGRGGRDGEPTTCVLLFNHADARVQEFLIDASYPSGELLRGLWKLLRENPGAGSHIDRLHSLMLSHIGGELHPMTVKSAVRILERHGFLRDEGGMYRAVKPADPEAYPALDVDSLARRAATERHKLRTMIEYAYYPRCRRQFVLDYFGDADWQDRELRCSGCDNCRGAGQARELSSREREAAEKLLSLVSRVSGRFGRTKLSALATGTDDDHRFADLPEHGALASYKPREVLDLLRGLEGAGLIEVSRGEYPVLAVTAQGKRAVRGELKLDVLTLLMPDRRRSKTAAKTAASLAYANVHGRADAANAAGEPEAPLAPLDADVVQRLRALRTELASEQAVPAYVIFSNKTLEAIARALPTTSDELLQVPGIGPQRLEAYGKRILRAVAGGEQAAS